MWRIQQRIERLNDLGFDVEELDIVTDFDGDKVRIQPRVVELGHHQRELQSLTGMLVEDNQARWMLNDVNRYIAHFDLDREDRQLAASKWMTEIYEPIVTMVPAEARGKLEPAELFHEILVHRWYLSEREGLEVDIFETARDYIDTVLSEEARRGAHLGARRSGRPTTSRLGWSDCVTARRCRGGAASAGRRCRRVELDELPHHEHAVGLQGDVLEPERHAVAVGHQGDVGGAARLAAERDGVRRAAGGAVGVAVADLAVGSDVLLRAARDVQVAAHDQVGAAALEGLAAQGRRRGPAAW